MRKPTSTENFPGRKAEVGRFRTRGIIGAADFYEDSAVDFPLKLTLPEPRL
jgi:hypothetical protein